MGLKTELTTQPTDESLTLTTAGSRSLCSVLFRNVAAKIPPHNFTRTETHRNVSVSYFPFACQTYSFMLL